MNLETKIFEVLNQHPGGMRLSYLSGETRTARMPLLNALYEMKNKGLVETVTISIPANMEYYQLWKLVK